MGAAAPLPPGSSPELRTSQLPLTPLKPGPRPCLSVPRKGGSGTASCLWPQVTQCPTGPQPARAHHPEPCARLKLSTPRRGEVKPKRPTGHGGALWTSESGPAAWPLTATEVPPCAHWAPTDPPARLPHLGLPRRLLLPVFPAPEAHTTQPRPSLVWPLGPVDYAVLGSRALPRPLWPPRTGPSALPAARGTPRSPGMTVPIPSTCACARLTHHARASRTRRSHVPARTCTQTPAVPCNPPGSPRTGKIAEILFTPIASPTTYYDTALTCVGVTAPTACVLHRPSALSVTSAQRGAWHMADPPPK